MEGGCAGGAGGGGGARRESFRVLPRNSLLDSFGT